MKKLLLKGGRVIVCDVPDAGEPQGQELKIQLLASAISAGTESATLLSSGLDIRRNKQLLNKVLTFARERGISAVLKKIEERFNQGVPLGYSAAGIVLACGPKASGFKPGDMAAIAGVHFASHAEINLASSRLAVAVPAGVSAEEASTVAIGAIALQSLRRLNPQIGEKTALIGLGLIGQITAQLLAAAGARVTAIEKDPQRLRFAKERGWIENGLSPEQAEETLIASLTEGYGFDGVIIAAHAPANPAPLDLAIKIARRRGTIVILGDVGLSFGRKNFYEKDLRLKIATSYGPGRYDPSYETEGLDYPYAFCRWSAQRNMACYLDLIAAKKIDVASLIQASYPISDAPKAYDALSGQTANRPLLTLLHYGNGAGGVTQKISKAAAQTPRASGTIRVGIIGAGSFVTSVHLPVLARLKEHFSLQGVCNKHPEKSRFIAQQYKIPKTYGQAEELLSDPDIDLILIGTRHNQHASLAAHALKAGKAVFLEKPMATTVPDFEILVQDYKDNPKPFHVGFNRRFSPLIRQMKSMLQNMPKPWTIQYRVAAEAVPANHWVLGDEGGGRIIGEACHMIDLILFLAQEAKDDEPRLPVNLHALSANTKENISVLFQFENNILATLTYSPSESRALGKERIEIITPPATLILQDFKELSVAPARGRKHETKLNAGAKGFAEEWTAFADFIKGKRSAAPLPFEDACQTTRLTFLVDELAKAL